MRVLLEKFLTLLARLYLVRYRPMIIGVTGNVGKTSTKDLIAAVLRPYRRIRAGSGNLNNEIGLPLSIVGDWSREYYERGSSGWFWIKVFAAGIVGLIASPDYPEVLILEYGADRPGDIRRLVHHFKPHLAVVTAIGEVPVHVEYFADAAALAREKSELVKAVPTHGTVVLNRDDSLVIGMQAVARAPVLTYGLTPEAQVYASNLEVLVQDGLPAGIVFKLHDGTRFLPVKLRGSLGRGRAINAAAAGATGLAIGLNLVQISEAIADHQGPNGRLKILKGIKDSLIIDDTYNAAPASTRLALETLQSLPAVRRIAALGNMLELGSYSFEAHRSIGTLAGEVADILVCVGDKAQAIAESAAARLPADRIFTFHTSDEAKLKIQEIIRPGDVILVKGSQGVRMEKIVEEIMAEPERKRELLVRQSEAWLNKR